MTNFRDADCRTVLAQLAATCQESVPTGRITSGLRVIRAGMDGAPLLRPAWGQMRLFFL